VKILLAQSAGFCFGVRRATTMAFEAAESRGRICSLGPIIHSPQLVEKLEEKGVRVLRQVEEITGGAVIIRSHGVTSQELDALAGRDVEIVDATCPFVKKAQEHAALLSREGYTVVLVGEKDHPEVQGIVSYAREGDVFVVADPDDALALPRCSRMGIVAQTTQSIENLRTIVDICLEKCKELRIYNTICDATSVRQNEARAIARQADVMLVIGGYNSANTNRLARICRDIQPKTHHIETAGQIESQWFDGAETVGITAGASTPRWIIDEVVKRVPA
jgi:4-hydroxy-3-methylbut-2-enyl diphosphate reductase